GAVNAVGRRRPGAHAVPPLERVACHRHPGLAREAATYLLLHKPRGYVTSLRDPEGRRVVVDLLPPGTPRVFPVGRLDYDVEGLLLLTDDGDLAHRLLHPRYEIPRVYEAEGDGRVTAGELARWRRGVALPDGPAVPTGGRPLPPAAQAPWIQLTVGEGR